MKLKKERNHMYGASNIDFRSKRDDSSIRTYMPWIMGKELGTMGLQDYKLTSKEKEKKFKSVSKLSTQKDEINEYPNPKYHQTAEFYSKNNMKIFNKKNLIEIERLGQLDESVKGKEKYIGDSMMISLNTKLKHKDKTVSTGDKIRKMLIQETLHRERVIQNKNVIQETQLVKMDAKETLEGKVDIKKINDIRLAIKRRYANRSNIRKLFKHWDISSNGFINLYDAHAMINKLAIPINFNETRALIASATEHNVLHVDDFVNLIHNDNQTLNLNLAALECK